MAGNEKPKIQQCPPAPTQSKVESKSELKKLSETLKIDSLVGSLSDAVGKPLLKGLDKVKEFGKSIEGEYHNLKVKYSLEHYSSFSKALESFIPDENARKEYIAILAEISKNIDRKEFESFIGSLNSYSSEQEFTEKDRIFKIDSLKELLGISKSLPGNFAFLGKKYLKEPCINKPFTRKEINDDARSLDSSSFTLAEMTDLFKKHGESAETIINFVDKQRMRQDFQNRKKIILSHLNSFKKIEPYIRYEIYYGDYAHFNLDLLKEGDHLGILVKLLKDGIIYSPFEPSFDRDYIKKYAAKLIEIKENVRNPILLPTKTEMAKNGDLLIKIAKNANALPYKDDNSISVTPLDKKIFSKFGWASLPVFDAETAKKNDLLKKIQKPENAKLLAELFQMYSTITDQYEKSMYANKNATKDNHELKGTIEQGKRIIKYRIASCLRLILSDAPSMHKDDSIFLEDFKKLIENYKKYPRIVAALQGRSYQANDTVLYPNNINELVKTIDPLIANSHDYKKISEIFEWIPSLRDWMNNPPNYDKEANKSLISLKEMLGSKWAMDLIHSNRDFLKSYLETTGIIDFHSPTFISDLIQNFPLQFLAGSKDKLLELSKKYDKPVLKGLLLYKIKTESELQFYVKNGEKLSAWFSSIIPEDKDADLVSFFQSSPSIYLLENHFAHLTKITDQTGNKFMPHIFQHLSDEAFFKKHGDLYFFFIDQAVSINYTDALSELKDAFRRFEPTIEKHKDKLKWIFSKSIAIRSLGEMASELDHLCRHNYGEGEDNKDYLLGKNWIYLKALIEEVTKYGELPPFFYHDISSGLVEGALHVSSPDELEGIKKKIKLYCIDGFDITPDQKVMFKSLLSENPMYDGKKESKIIEDFFDQYGELPAKSDKNYSEYLKKLNNLRDSLPALVFSRIFSANKYVLTKILEENIGYLNDDDLDVINILLSINSDNKVIEKFIDEANDDYMDDARVKSRQTEYLLRDHRDGSDLRDFNYQKIDLYEKLFYNIRVASLTKLEQEIINTLRFKKFGKEMASKSIFEIENIITGISNRIDPRIGEILFQNILLPRLSDELIIGKTLAQWSGKNINGETIKIDVTQNNLAKINTVLRILNKTLALMKDGNEATKDNPNLPAQAIAQDSDLAQNIVANIKIIFPNFNSTGNPTADIKWLFEKFDVEEINFKKLDSLAEFIEFQQLLSSMEETNIRSSVRYLENKFKDIDFSKMSFDGVDYSVFEMQKIEQLRALVNIKSRVVGDMLVDIIGSKFLESNCCDYTNIGKLIKFAHVWENPGLDRDINGLYQVYSTYAYVEIAAFIKTKLEKNKSDENREEVKKSLESAGVNLDEIVKELVDKNYLVLTESNAQKALSAMKKGFVSYTFRKSVSKVFGGDSLEFDGKKIEVKESDWAKRPGVKVYSLSEGNREIAKLIKCDPGKIKVKVLAEASGMVDMDAEAKELGRKLIFSAPLTFTTGARKMTELAFRDGIQMNYLLSPYSKDGFLLVNQKGEQKVLNKKRLKIGDMVSPEDLGNEEIRALLIKWTNGNKVDIDETKLDSLLNMPINPVQKFLDKKTFFELMRLKKYSLLGGMLLIDKHEGKDEGTVSKLNDGNDSRRFYLQFEDGQFGIMDSTEPMSSAQMTELALSVGATKAIYMDTGMYDMAAYQDGSGKTHIMGHEDTSKSSNRVVIYEQ